MNTLVCLCNSYIIKRACYNIFRVCHLICFLDPLTFTVVWEMKEQRFKAASVGPKLFPHNFAEQDNGHIIIYLPQRGNTQKSDEEI